MSASLAAVHPIYWHLPFLIVVVSLVYSATRFDQWGAILREAFRWGLRMTLFLFGIVLILSGLSLDNYPMYVRVLLTGIGLVLEVSLLFVK
jgi:integral membrane sensor domain MASE1